MKTQTRWFSDSFLFILLSVFVIIPVVAQPGGDEQKEISIEMLGAHDPVMIREGNTYYLFMTGRGISAWSSKDMKTWQRCPDVLNPIPQWAIDEVPGYKGHTWAPDILFHEGTFYLYYSCSSFGKNSSAIGVATNKTLDPNSTEYKWTDQGKVVASVPGRDLFNTIDPNVIFDEQGTPWLFFGSFWGGIKMVKLDTTLTKLAEPQQWHTVARQVRTFGLDEKDPGDGAIEAPFVFRHGNFYYLFVSLDYCCRGLKSTYKVAVGRSESITGPYLDKEGMALVNGGGTILIKGNEKWSAVGHNAVCTFDGTDYMVCHGYDTKSNGRSLLIIAPLTWDTDGWPVVEKY
ncbi:MAG TPA: arabinan endo-1,5-alpha-L-arabinosidase [Bacteroidales bacterium]